MPGGITITTTVEDLATPMFKRLGAAVQRPDIRKVMGRAMATQLRKHFSRLDSERANKLGGSRTHFYGQARRGVQQPEITTDGVVVAINNVGIAQRYFGGDIEAAPGGKLTIPVNPAAYGHRAREFSDLHAIYFQDGSGILVKSRTESKGNIGEVFYRLVKRVHQEEDPTVLPTEDEMQENAMQAGAGYLDTLKEGSK
jgi:hypothetical protein